MPITRRYRFHAREKRRRPGYDTADAGGTRHALSCAHCCHRHLHTGRFTRTSGRACPNSANAASETITRYQTALQRSRTLQGRDIGIASAAERTILELRRRHLGRPEGEALRTVADGQEPGLSLACDRPANAPAPPAWAPDAQGPGALRELQPHGRGVEAKVRGDAEAAGPSSATSSVERCKERGG